MLIDRLSINTTMNEPATLQLPAAYRTVITRKILGLFEGRVDYYEHIPSVTKYMCRIVVSVSL